MDTIKDVLDGMVNKNSVLRSKLRSFKAGDLWHENVDRENKSWVYKVSQGTIYAATENPSFCQDIVFKKREIMDMLNRNVGENVISDIRIKIAQREREK